MNFVDKEDDVALTLYFVNKSLNTALKLSTELSTGNESGKVKEIELLVSQIERNIACVYSLSDTLSDSGLTYTGFTDKAWIVLGPS